MLVKICGLTELEDILAAIEQGADFLGFNFYPESPRYLSPDKAENLFSEIPPNIPKVGVFVNEDAETIIELACALELDYLQFHGDEPPEFCAEMARPWIKVFRLKQTADLEKIRDYQCEWILVDADSKSYGGSGKKADWSLAKQAKNFGRKVFLAGGLTPHNIQEAIAAVEPFAVDVSSGIETSPGKKDLKKMDHFIRLAKRELYSV